MYQILAVDDENNILSALKRNLIRIGNEANKSLEMDVDCFDDPIEALKSAETKRYDLVISDYRMPRMNGVEFLLFFRARQPDAVRIILSGYADMDGLIGAINEAEIFRFLSKPWQEGELRHAVAQGLLTRRLMLENRQLADKVRQEQDKVKRHEILLAKLESESPGITKVHWGPNGEVLLDE